MRGIHFTLLAGLLLAGCANNDWVNSHIADGPQEARQLAIDEGYCTAVVDGTSPVPNPRVYSSSPSTYAITGSTMSTGTGGTRFGTFNSTVTAMPTPSQNTSNTIANAGALASVIGSNIRRARIYDGCMMSLGWDDASDAAEAAPVEVAASTAATAAPSAPREVAAAPAASSAGAAPAAGSGDPTVPCSSFIAAGSRLSQDVAAIGPGGACMPMSLGANTTGNTLVAEGAGVGGARVMVVVSRSDQPLGGWAAIQGREDELLSHMTSPGSDTIHRLPVQSTTTIGGHRIELVGFTGNRPTDPVQYACVAASDRTSEKTVAIVCRPTASGSPDAVARNIVSQDLPAIRW